MSLDHLNQLPELQELAGRYIWWRSPQDALQRPERVISQVMEMGDYDDVLKLIRLVGEDVLRDHLLNAEPGIFSPKSWYFWHYRLGVLPVPDLPRQDIG